MKEFILKLLVSLGIAFLSVYFGRVFGHVWFFGWVGGAFSVATTSFIGFYLSNQ